MSDRRKSKLKAKQQASNLGAGLEQVPKAMLTDKLGKNDKEKQLQWQMGELDKLSADVRKGLIENALEDLKTDVENGKEDQKDTQELLKAAKDPKVLDQQKTREKFFGNVEMRLSILMVQLIESGSISNADVLSTSPQQLLQFLGSKVSELRVNGKGGKKEALSAHQKETIQVAQLLPNHPLSSVKEGWKTLSNELQANVKAMGFAAEIVKESLAQKKDKQDSKMDKPTVKPPPGLSKKEEDTWTHMKEEWDKFSPTKQVIIAALASVASIVAFNWVWGAAKGASKGNKSSIAGLALLGGGIYLASQYLPFGDLLNKLKGVKDKIDIKKLEGAHKLVQKGHFKMARVLLGKNADRIFKESGWDKLEEEAKREEEKEEDLEKLDETNSITISEALKKVSDEVKVSFLEPIYREFKKNPKAYAAISLYLAQTKVGSTILKYITKGVGKVGVLGSQVLFGIAKLFLYITKTLGKTVVKHPILSAALVGGVLAAQHESVASAFSGTTADKKKKGIETGKKAIKKVGEIRIPTEKSAYVKSVQEKIEAYKSSNPKEDFSFLPSAEQVESSYEYLVGQEKLPDLQKAISDISINAGIEVMKGSVTSKDEYLHQKVKDGFDIFSSNIRTLRHHEEDIKLREKYQALEGKLLQVSVHLDRGEQLKAQQVKELINFCSDIDSISLTIDGPYIAWSHLKDGKMLPGYPEQLFLDPGFESDNRDERVKAAMKMIGKRGQNPVEGLVKTANVIADELHLAWSEIYGEEKMPKTAEERGKVMSLELKKGTGAICTAAGYVYWAKLKDGVWNMVKIGPQTTFESLIKMNDGELEAAEVGVNFGSGIVSVTIAAATSSAIKKVLSAPKVGIPLFKHMPRVAKIITWQVSGPLMLIEDSIAIKRGVQNIPGRLKAWKSLRQSNKFEKLAKASLYKKLRISEGQIKALESSAEQLQKLYKAKAGLVRARLYGVDELSKFDEVKGILSNTSLDPNRVGSVTGTRADEVMKIVDEAIAEQEAIRKAAKAGVESTVDTAEAAVDVAKSTKGSWLKDIPDEYRGFMDEAGDLRKPASFMDDAADLGKGGSFMDEGVEGVGKLSQSLREVEGVGEAAAKTTQAAEVAKQTAKFDEALEIVKNGGHLTIEQFGELRRASEADQLADGLKSIGMADDAAEAAAKAMKTEKELGKMMKALDALGVFKFGRGLKGLMELTGKLMKVLGPVAGIAGAGFYGYEGYVAYQMAQATENNPELKNAFMNKSWTGGSAAVGELLIVGAEIGGAVALLPAMIIGAGIMAAAHMATSAFEAEAEIAMKSNDYLKLGKAKGRNELLHRWYTTGDDLGAGESYSSFFRIKYSTESFHMERSTTRLKIVEALLLMEGGAEELEKSDFNTYRMRYIMAVTTDLDVANFHDGQKVLESSRLFASIMSKRDKVLEYRTGAGEEGLRKINLSDPSYDADKISRTQIPLIMQVARRNTADRMQENLAGLSSQEEKVPLMSRITGIDPNYLNYAVNVIFEYLGGESEGVSDEDLLKWQKLAMNIIEYLGFTGFGYQPQSGGGNGKESFDAVRHVLLNSKATPKSLHENMEGFAPASPGISALNEVAKFYNFRKTPTLANLQLFFKEEYASLFGLYWNGSQWCTNDKNGLDEGHGSNVDAAVKSMIKEFTEGAGDEIESRFDNAMDFNWRGVRDDAMKRTAQVKHIASLMQSGYNKHYDQKARLPEQDHRGWTSTFVTEFGGDVLRRTAEGFSTVGEALTGDASKLNMVKEQLGVEAKKVRAKARTGLDVMAEAAYGDTTRLKAANDQLVDELDKKTGGRYSATVNYVRSGVGNLIGSIFGSDDDE